MNQAELQRKLFVAARAQPPSERVPYAFEKRVMAHLHARVAVDIWGFWARALSRAAASCLAVALLLGAWLWFAPASSQNHDWSQDFENTVLAAADQESSTESVW